MFDASVRFNQTPGQLGVRGDATVQGNKSVTAEAYVSYSANGKAPDITVNVSLNGKPLLTGSLGVNFAKLDGKSPAALLGSLLALSQQQSAENKRTGINQFINDILGVDESSSSKGPSGEGFDADVAAAVVSWASKPENLKTVMQYAVQVAQAAVTAVATGGTSLAADLPALGMSGLAIAGAVLEEAGIPLDDLVGQAATELLMKAGMEPADAVNWGKFIGSASGAAVQAYAFYQSGGQTPLDGEKFGNVARDLGVLLGADPKLANTIGAGVGGAVNLGSAIANGNAQMLLSGNASTLMVSGNAIAEQFQSLLNGGNVDLQGMLDSTKAFATAFDGLLGDLEKDTGIKGLKNQLLQPIFAQVQGLGPFFDTAVGFMDMAQSISNNTRRYSA